MTFKPCTLITSNTLSMIIRILVQLNIPDKAYGRLEWSYIIAAEECIRIDDFFVVNIHVLSLVGWNFNSNLWKVPKLSYKLLYAFLYSEWNDQP